MLKRNLAILSLIAAAGGSAAFTAPARVLDLAQTLTLAHIVGDTSLRAASGADLRVFRFAARDAGGKERSPSFKFFVEGGLHGNEEQGSNFVIWLARRYGEGHSLLNLLPRDQVAIDFLPYANPDGSGRNTRVNGRGVNLNRNFGVLWGVSRENPGAGSFSEPETRAIKALMEKEKYTAAVDVHGYVNWVVSPSAPDAVAALPGIKVTKEKRAAYRAWTNALKDEMAVLPNYQLKTGATLGDGGAFEDWAFWSNGTLAYCLEIEGIQRFVKVYRRDFADLTKEPEGHSVDLFTRYEAMVYRMFADAMKLSAERQESTLVSSP